MSTPSQSFGLTLSIAPPYSPSPSERNLNFAQRIIGLGRFLSELHEEFLRVALPPSLCPRTRLPSSRVKDRFGWGIMKELSGVSELVCSRSRPLERELWSWPRRNLEVSLSDISWLSITVLQAEAPGLSDFLSQLRRQ